MLARIRAARARRYAVTYFSHTDSASSSARVGGRVYRTRRAAMADAMRYAGHDIRGGEYAVARVA